MLPSTVQIEFAPDPRTKQGLLWIGSHLENIAKEFNICIESWSWQVSADTTGDNVYALSAVGARKKRAVKLFNRTEIEQCPSNQQLQEEILQRLIKLIAFLGPNQ